VRHHRSILVLLAVATALGCAGDGAKGAEDDVFDDYEAKADSFSQPTQHGTLAFGVAQDAELAAGALYHAWDFELSDDAVVTIGVELVTPNLDTVMYLYRRNPDTGAYGRYIRRNDDADGSTVASRISGELSAGSYRVLVKGYKTSFLGDFRLHAECEGSGCTGQGECSTADFRDLPEPGAAACGAVLSAALDATISTTGSATVTLEESCGLPDAARYGVELYYKYWSDLAGWSDMFEFDGPASIEVEWTGLSHGGAVVRCDAGGDEAAMDFWLDAGSQLVAYYQHNQSPDFALFCDGGQAEVDEECGHLYLDAMPHQASLEQAGTEEGVTEADAADRLDAVALLAYQEYVRELSLQANEPVTVESVTWENEEAGDWDLAGRVTVSASGRTAHSYEIADLSTTQFLFTVAVGAGDPVLDCREL